MNDNDLERALASAAGGDARALRTLYDATSGTLFALCLRVLHDRQRAEIALQEAYLKIWRYAERYPAAGVRPLTWMVGITRNLCIERLRGEGAAKARLDAAVSVADGTERSEEKTMMRSGSRLASCLASLDAAERRLVRLGYYGALTAGAFAEREGLHREAAEDRLRSLAGKLRRCLLG